MKRIYALVLITFALFFVTTSCSDKDGPSIENIELISATYSPASKKFTLKYSEGTTQTVDAIVDNTVSPPIAKATLKDGTVISVADATKEAVATIGPIPLNVSSG